MFRSVVSSPLLLLHLCQPPMEQRRLVSIHLKLITDPPRLFSLTLKRVFQQRLQVPGIALLCKFLNLLRQRVDLCLYLPPALFPPLGGPLPRVPARPSP